MGCAAASCARTAVDLPGAMDAIEAARRQGYWTALLLSFSLGERLEPAGCANPRSRALPTVRHGSARSSSIVLMWNTPGDLWTMAGRQMIRPRMHLGLYKQWIDRIKGRIEVGNVCQVNFTFRWMLRSWDAPLCSIWT